MSEEIYNECKERMDKTILHYHSEISTIRTGRASTALLDSIKVDFYGTINPLNNIALISVPDPHLITIQPYDPNALEAIEKAIEENPDLILVTFNKTSIHEEKIIYSDDNIIKTKSVVQSGHMIVTHESSIDLKNYIVDKSQNLLNTATINEYVFYSQDKCYHK